MANINNFISSFKDTELARPCNFDVSIFPTSVKLIDALGTASLKAGMNPIDGFRNISLRCEATELPSRSFTLVEQKTYGPLKPFPIQTTYSKINFTFICSDHMFEKWLFDSWMNYMSNATFFPFPTTVSGVVDMFLDAIDPVTGFKLPRPPVNYDFEYKSNYESFVLITQYDLQHNPSFYAGLFHAFPISVNELPLSWNNGNAIHKLSVTFAYNYHNSATTNNFVAPLPIF